MRKNFLHSGFLVQLIPSGKAAYPCRTDAAAACTARRRRQKKYPHRENEQGYFERKKAIDFAEAVKGHLGLNAAYTDVLLQLWSIALRI